MSLLLAPPDCVIFAAKLSVVLRVRISAAAIRAAYDRLYSALPCGPANPLDVARLVLDVVT